MVKKNSDIFSFFCRTQMTLGRRTNATISDGEVLSCAALGS